MYQLTQDQYQALSSAYCDLASLQMSLGGVVSEGIEARIHNAKDKMDLALSDIRELIEARDNRLRNIATDVALAEKFVSYWSLDPVEDFDTVATPYQGCRSLSYTEHWGNRIVTVGLPLQFSWRDLWRAANDAILQSGDLHHVFIESFEVGKDGTLILGTGS